MINSVHETKEMKIYKIVTSLLAAFFGVKNNKKFKEDERFIEEHGVKYFLIVGFFMVFLGLIFLGILVTFIVG